MENLMGYFCQSVQYSPPPFLLKQCGQRLPLLKFKVEFNGIANEVAMVKA